MAISSYAKNSCKKGKCVVVWLESKLAIFDCLKVGATQEKLAVEYRIGHLTVRDIEMNEEKIQSFALTMESMAISKKA